MITLHSSSRKQLLLLQLLNKRNPAKNPISKGFTLIELLVVIVILGVLGAVGYQAYVSQIGRANAAQAQNTATALAKNCAALLVTGDEDQFADAIANISVSDDVVVNAPVCALDSPHQVTVGTGQFLRDSTAVVNPNGSVTPGAIDEGGGGADGGADVGT